MGHQAPLHVLLPPPTGRLQATADSSRPGACFVVQVLHEWVTLPYFSDLQDRKVRLLFKLIADYREKWATHSECWGHERTPALADARNDPEDLDHDQKLLAQQTEQACYSVEVEPDAPNEPAEPAEAAETPFPEEAKSSRRKKLKKFRMKRLSSASSSKIGEVTKPGDIACEPSDDCPHSPVPESDDVLPSSMTDGLSEEELKELNIVQEKIAALEAECLRLGFLQLLS